MRVFVDTSAFLALIDSNDKNNSTAIEKWDHLVELDSVLLSHNYIAVETIALVQNRFGMDPLEPLVERIFPAVKFKWIDKDFHETVLKQHCRRSSKSISFVDSVSFQFLEEESISRAFVFDSDFKQEDLEIL